ncbi:alpha/beta fold hydrolase [Paenibacillus sp. MMS18-CY102]|uniref:alpha/beta fold hydrolase n=1 Tax=Paenibacillus sp. MMS18-CY102 TaxID=2682849 RepID=UPI0013653BD9|nr:alpha/beta fold hydrolase [Paenibacillus sp. MMS18-CY102]MWC30093.1 alpha/beta fold hydrolase [Paenibacillus sp. MMS18-CY102]
MNNEQPCAFVWLPGWSFTVETFLPLRSYLPVQACHYDAQFSSVSAEEQLYAAATEAVRKARLELNAHTMLIAIGWSLGGMLALRLASEGLIDAAVPISASARFVRDRDNREDPLSGGWDPRQLKRMQAALGNDQGQVETRFRAITLSDADRELAIEGHLSPAGKWTASALTAGLDYLLNENLAPLLPKLQCPTLLIHGTADEICPAATSHALHANIQQSELCLLEGAGHAPFLANPQKVGRTIKEWVHANY